MAKATVTVHGNTRPWETKLPPGVVFLLRNLPTIIGPSAFVYALTKLANLYLTSTSFIRHVPTSRTRALACILSFPLWVWGKMVYAVIKEQIGAQRAGALLPPRVRDWTPGSFKSLRRGLDNLKGGYPGDYLREWEEEYRRMYNYRVLFENRFVTTEPEHIKAILATQFEGFEKGRKFNIALGTVLGTGVFNSDGEMWKFHRGMTRPFFSKDRVSHFEIFERHAVNALDQLKARLREGFPVDIQDLASRFTMDSATEFLFAHDVHSLAAGLPYPHYSPLVAASSNADHPANQFAKAFDEAQRLTSLRMRRGGFWPLMEFWKDKVEEQMCVVRGFIEPIVADAVEGRRRERERGEGELGDKEVKEGESLLEHLVKLTDDETILRDETLNILFAGRDTTTNSITFSVYLLAENPHVLKRLRREILEKVGNRRPTYDDMREMKYLRAVINETLRLYPAVPFNFRTSIKPVILPNMSGGRPFYVPPQCGVTYGVFLMHRRHDLWGPDADVFDPDRFIDERLKKYLTPNPFIFLPFNAGPRICLGQQFAYHETSYFLVRLLQKFSDIKLDLEAQPSWAAPPPEWKDGVGTQRTDKIRMKNYLTMSVMGGVWVRLEEATDMDDQVDSTT
ncbi:cytochrome P450 [Macrolepiota fuliginosa MF-IS2]|uniref:Cytochrome P450 n=1 Tax=Macrolepiota fuliginosa MF-IS2 TaxID=1400762 RepID=A0A9P5X4W2_9AGAR|nr:cytochrome P450 [Macrolepiota fuliginosa MF-IS2]